jgi:hypothetical protein
VLRAAAVLCSARDVQLLDLPYQLARPSGLHTAQHHRDRGCVRPAARQYLHLGCTGRRLVDHFALRNLPRKLSNEADDLPNLLSERGGGHPRGRARHRVQHLHV